MAEQEDQKKPGKIYYCWSKFDLSTVINYPGTLIFVSQLNHKFLFQQM